MSTEIHFTRHPAEALNRIVDRIRPSSLFAIADTNTYPLVAEAMLSQANLPAKVTEIVIDAGDDNKSLDSLARIWAKLSERGATRHSLIINIGGGMITDLGGFAAATFKRGVKFINIPTTLLSAVDAAVGGKTGINFHGLKNEIGAFAPASAVIISSSCFCSLPHLELCSGYAELLKHSLLESDESLAATLSYDLDRADLTQLQPLLEQSVKVKERIVAEDPFEKGIRKALNLGHTIAHAVESLAMERHRPVAHGIAVAFGLVVDLVLSHMQTGLDTSTLNAVAYYVRDYFPKPEIACTDYPTLIELMRHDKKNLRPDQINFTLLSAPGHPEIDCHATPQAITTALDIARDLLAI